MKICLPIKNNQGIDSDVSNHFGSAPFFMIIDTETLDTKIIINTNQQHTHGMCQPLALLGDEKFDGIVVGGIGMGALNKLKTAGIKVYKTQCLVVKDVVAAAKTESLTEMKMEGACSHHHGDEHGDKHHCGEPK